MPKAHISVNQPGPEPSGVPGVGGGAGIETTRWQSRYPIGLEDGWRTECVSGLPCQFSRPPGACGFADRIGIARRPAGGAIPESPARRAARATRLGSQFTPNAKPSETILTSLWSICSRRQRRFQLTVLLTLGGVVMFLGRHEQIAWGGDGRLDNDHRRLARADAPVPTTGGPDGAILRNDLCRLRHVHFIATCWHQIRALRYCLPW